MGIDYDPPTTDTRIHRDLTKLLEAMGYGVEPEASFPPYSVDCYVESLHVAFEADGPTHTKKADQKRDDVLMANYALPVVHVSQSSLTGNEVHKFKMLARSILQCSWNGSADERRSFSGV